MIVGRDAQAEPCFASPLERRHAEARAQMALLTRLIRDELAAFPQLDGRRQGRRRAWILEAQARRRDWLAYAGRCRLLLEQQAMAERLIRPLAAE